MGILAAAETEGKITFGVDGLLKYEIFGQELWITNTHVSLLLVVLTLTILSLFANRAIKKADPNKEKVLVLTEPLCDLETRERIFRDIVNQYGGNADVFLKPHPRDVLNYEEKFSECVVIQGKFPMEVMNFIPGIRWDRVVSVLTVTDAITCADDILFLGRDFLDHYEAPEIHRQNEYI